MIKRQLHRAWKIFRRIRPVYFLILAVVLGVIASFALRSNYVQMTELREAVYTADRDNGDVQKALNELQAYVISHMNTSLNSGKTGVYPPIQLQHTYQRLVQAQAAGQQGANGDLYTRAQAYCQQQNASDYSGRNRVPCIEKYVQENGSATNMGSKIDPSLYQFDFLAARWSPDLAGWSLVSAILFLILAAAKFIADFFIKRAHRP